MTARADHVAWAAWAWAEGGIRDREQLAAALCDRGVAVEVAPVLVAEAVSRGAVRRPRALVEHVDAAAGTIRYSPAPDDEREVRALPCSSCGAPPPSTVHHDPPRSVELPAGRTRDLVPLCRPCHDRVHGIKPNPTLPTGDQPVGWAARVAEGVERVRELEPDLDHEDLAAYGEAVALRTVAGVEPPTDAEVRRYVVRRRLTGGRRLDPRVAVVEILCPPTHDEPPLIVRREGRSWWRLTQAGVVLHTGRTRTRALREAARRCPAGVWIVAMSIDAADLVLADWS